MGGFSKILIAAKAIPTSVRFNLLKKATPAVTQIITRGSHGRTMFIRPGKFYTKKYMDMIHFHLCLSALPFAALVGYLYLFQGQAVLTEIAEDHEPRYYEYHRDPVKRFLAKNVFEVPERSYEEHMSFIYREQCKQKMRALESKVRDMMKEKQDYKAWYYVPVVKEGYEQKAQFNEDFGRQGYDVKYAPSSKK